MESSTISNTALPVLSALLDRMTYTVAASKIAANDSVYHAVPGDVPAARTYLTHEARDALYDELYGFIEGNPDVDSLCSSLKTYIDSRMDRNMVNGITNPKDDVHCVVLTQLCDDLARAITHTPPHKRIGSEPLSDEQRYNVVMLTALKSYYKTGFDGLRALYRLSQYCMAEHTAGSKNLSDVIDHVAKHSTIPEPYDMPELHREYAASFIRGRIMQHLFLDRLQPVPAQHEWPQEISPHMFLLLDQYWATAQRFVRSHQPDLDEESYRDQVCTTVQPMLQRLYKSGTWRCEAFTDIAQAFSGLRHITRLHGEEKPSEVTRT